MRRMESILKPNNSVTRTCNHLHCYCKIILQELNVNHEIIWNFISIF